MSNGPESAFLSHKIFPFADEGNFTLYDRTKQKLSLRFERGTLCIYCKVSDRFANSFAEGGAARPKAEPNMMISRSTIWSGDLKRFMQGSGWCQEELIERRK